MGTTRRTASGSYCKTLIAIQRADQKFRPFWAVIVVWRDKTSYSTSRDSIAISRKMASRNYWKPWARSNSRIKIYCLFQLLFRSGARRPPLQRVGILKGLQGKRPPETTVKLWACSNGRIKSYGPFQMLDRSGETRLPLQRVGIPWVLQGKRPPETTVKLWARSNSGIISYGPFQLLYRSGSTRPPLQRVGIP